MIYSILFRLLKGKLKKKKKLSKGLNMKTCSVKIQSLDVNHTLGKHH